MIGKIEYTPPIFYKFGHGGTFVRGEFGTRFHEDENRIIGQILNRIGFFVRQLPVLRQRFGDKTPSIEEIFSKARERSVPVGFCFGLAWVRMSARDIDDPVDLSCDLMMGIVKQDADAIAQLTL